jgi:hypothetical protein
MPFTTLIFRFIYLSLFEVIKTPSPSDHLSAAQHPFAKRDKIVDSGAAGHHEGLLHLYAGQLVGVLLVTHNATQTQLGTPVERITVHGQ